MLKMDEDYPIVFLRHFFFKGSHHLGSYVGEGGVGAEGPRKLKVEVWESRAACSLSRTFCSNCCCVTNFAIISLASSSGIGSALHACKYKQTSSNGP